ncbi:MAG TPA: hypothetical protein VHZ29_01590 [Rhizomicrobium sp.]|jgi:hypothetical protein|nr:hypothetical protein [Rhizomicrobium sp.]
MRQFLRNVAILLGCGLLIAYAAVFALLVTYQRNLLFIGGRHEEAMRRKGAPMRSSCNRPTPR